MTAKLKLYTTPEQFTALRHTQLANRDALNYVSCYAFEHGKMSSGRALQRECYDEIRARYHLPAQMACNVPPQVGATYKGLDQAPKYVSPTLIYNFHRGYSLREEAKVSILTLYGRVIVPYTGYSAHVTLLRTDAHIGAAKLWYDKPHKQFYSLISPELEVADPTPQMHKDVVGVDAGQRCLAVTTDTRGKTAFYSGKAAHVKADHYARLTKRLQHKGTRSATRRLIVLSGRERRLKQAVNHAISHRIVTSHPHSLIGLEDLTHIRERTKRTHGKKASKKQRRANRHASQWAFAELHGSIAYKASLNGSMAIKVDAYQTSQACPKCGYVSPDNRPNKGLLFVCQTCHFSLHADLIGARNITLRALLTRQDWMSTGVSSVRPDASDHEAKAANRQRYAELRWSPDASPALRRGVIDLKFPVSRSK